MKKKKTIPIEIVESGRIIDIKRDVMTIEGIPNCVYGEMLYLESGDKGLVIEFDEEKIVALLIGSGINVKAGDKVFSRSDLFKIPVTEDLIGRIVNGLILPLDGKGKLSSDETEPVFRDAPGIMLRAPIDEPFHTGIKLIDTIIPLGKGQRELVLGDRQTGKTTIAIDTIINQKDSGVICIYCWVGGSYNSMLKVVETLNAKGAMDYTVFVAAPASVSSSEQYLAPYTACALGEYFLKKGKDVFVVFDNLTRHAWIYRQIALLLNRSPGREAYPGDIFYIHSQLMERACRLKPEIGGSMTFMPIADTLQGDISGYIQTNLISMTDGQIYTSSSLFNEGFKPAVDIGLSVSRIGSKVQSPAVKEISAGLRSEYIRFKELEKLIRLRTRISDKAAKKIAKGRALTQILTQNANEPVEDMEVILIFYAFKSGIFEKISSVELERFEKNILSFLEDFDPECLSWINEEKNLTENVKKRLDRVFAAFLNKNKTEETKITDQ
ncbi:MAG: F0F1 ATP synthase subunit alpha [Candidatus Omnitrophota bacterium]